ncbi:MAG TPA: ATP-binding protein [Anaerolineales bacterium]|nr:ATP-binding protein [Anaerolineales bacterium]
MSIRFKVILPYLLLTLLVAVTGAFVVTRLVSSSLEERLANQLLEAGRVVSDTMARQEIDHVQSARLVAYVRGFGEALRDGDEEQIILLAKPVAGSLNVESVIVYDGQGAEALHILRQSDGSILDVSQRGNKTTLSIVDELLAQNDPNSLPKRTLDKDPFDGGYYYFTSIPVSYENEVVGVVVVGTSLDTLVPRLRSVSSSDVIFYDASGMATSSTLGVNAADPLFLRTFTIDKAFYEKVVNQDDIVDGENFEVEERLYRSGFSPLKISDDRIGVFAVVLPMQFVVDQSTVNRNNYVFLYSAAMIAVILVGYYIARIIINPLSSLVRTSRAIADGDLTKRTGVATNDEIGVLANTFDDMTEHLQERTIELEKTNQILEQMDRTKIRFIQVSAHELRTPLTLVQGYAQMVQMKAKDNPDFEKYANGIVDGTTRMVDIIDNLLDASRIDSNLLEAHLTQIQIAELIEKAQKIFEDSLEERNISFATDGVSDLPDVDADENLLYKVFYHVIMNAIKYTPEGGSVTVGGRVIHNEDGNSEVEVSVRDTGIGIDQQYHELVFEKFYQTGEVLLHSSGKTKFKGGGPGLGLAIARGIMDAHNGRIWLESPGYDEEKNPGTTVFIRLPLNGQK